MFTWIGYLFFYLIVDVSNIQNIVLPETLWIRQVKFNLGL